MAIITLEDLDGQIDGTLFAETFAEVIGRYPNAVSNEAIVLVRGKVDKKRENPSLLVNEVIPIESAVDRLSTSLGIKLEKLRHRTDDLERIKQLLSEHKGTREVYIKLRTDVGQTVTMKLNRDMQVKPCKALVDRLAGILGDEAIELGGDGARRRRRLQAQQALFKEEAAPSEDVLPADSVGMMDQEMET